MNTTRQPGRPTDLEEGALRGRILQVAAKLFAENGYTGTSIQHIVDAAATTKPMVYYYFQNKEGLYRELVLAFYENVRQQLDQIDASKGTTKDKLIAVAEANFELVRKSPDLSWFGFVSYFSSHKDASQVNLEEKGTANFLTIQRIVEDGITTGEIAGNSAEIALSFSGLIVIYIMAQVMNPEINALGADSAKRLVHLLYDGIRAK